jgi:hypothetical protein
MNNHLPLPAKKPYQSHSLTVYGDIRTTTLANANMSSPIDGGTGSNKKTA